MNVFYCIYCTTCSTSHTTKPFRRETNNSSVKVGCVRGDIEEPGPKYLSRNGRNAEERGGRRKVSGILCNSTNRFYGMWEKGKSKRSTLPEQDRPKERRCGALLVVVSRPPNVAATGGRTSLRSSFFPGLLLFCSHCCTRCQPPRPVGWTPTHPSKRRQRPAAATTMKFTG